MIPVNKVIKWISAAALALLLFAGLAIFGVVLFLNSSHGQKWLVDRVNAAIAGEIGIAEYHLSLFKGTLDISGVSLKDPKGMGVAGFEKLYVKISWRSLLKKEIRISEIYLQKPVGRLYMDNADRLNLLDATALSTKEQRPEEEITTSKGLPLNVVLEYLKIEKGDISFDYPKKALSAQFTGINFWADGDVASQRANLKLELDNLDLKSADLHLPPSNMAASLGLKRTKVDINYLNIGLGESNIELNGVISKIYELAGMDLKIHSTVDIAEIAKTFHVENTLKGNAVFDVSLTGEAQNPRVDLNAELLDGNLYNRVIDRIALKATLLDRQLSIRTALVEMAQGKVNLTGKADLRRTFSDGFFNPPTNLDAITYDIALEQTAPNLGPWVPEVAGLGGDLKSSLTLSGKGASATSLEALLTLKVNGKRLTAKGVRRPLKGSFGLNAEISGQAFSLKHLDGNIDGIKVNGSGSYDPKSRSAVAQLMLDAQNLSQPLSLFGLPHAKGALKLSLDLAGTLDLPQICLVMESKDLGYNDITIGTVQVAADLSPNRVLQISSLNLDNQGSRIEGQAQVRFLKDWKGIDPEYDQRLELTLQGLKVRDFYHQDIIRGNVDGRLALYGILEDLKGTLRLDGHDLAMENINLGNLNTRMRLRGNLLELNSLRLQNKDSELNGNGQVLLLDETFGKLVEDPRFQLVLSSENLHLQDFFENLSGHFKFDTQLSGSVKHPVGSIALQGRDLETGAQSIAAVDLSAHLKDDRVSVEPLKIILKENDTLTLNGWAQSDRSFDFELDSKKIELSSIDKLKDFKGLKGILTTHIAGHGSLDDPVVDGNLSLEKIFLNDQPIDDIRLDIGLHEHLLSAYGDLDFVVDASYHLLKKNFTAKLDFHDTKLDPYLRIAGQPDMSGEIDGQIRVSGNADHPTDMVARLSLNTLALYLKKNALLQTKQFNARMANQHISVEKTQINLLSQGKLTLAGSARLNGPIDLTLDGRLPIVDAGVFSEALVDASGDVVISAKVSGSLPKPQVNADLALTDLGLTIPQTGQRIEKLGGNIRIDPENISVEKINGNLDTGKFALNGVIAHDFFKPNKIDLDINANSLPIEVPDMLSLLVNSQIQIVGENGKAKATGDIVLVSGSYYRDVNINLLLLETIGKRTRGVSPPSEPLELPFFKEIDLDIDVSHREPFLVQNNLAEMEIESDLTVGGTLNRPVVNGRADVTSGIITFKKKTFTVEKGVIDFVNPYKTEMAIDIVSVANVRDEWEITLTLKGTPENLDLRLSSVPDESDADILSLLIFEKTSKELANGGTQNQTSTKELLTGILAETLAEELKGATDMVDILELEMGEKTDTTTGNGTGSENGNSEESDRVKVTMGKHLSDRITVKVAVESKDGEMVQRAISEYKFLEHVLLSGFQDTQGVYGGELVFRIEFR